MRIAFATCGAMPDGSPDDHPAARLLGAEFVAWDDAGVDWEAYDRVVLRSVWDYTSRIEEFLAWCAAVGPGRLRNQPDLVAYNADKRYLGELSAPTVPTTFVASGDELPVLDGEFVVKPNVSAGARNTGRFGVGGLEQARALVERIHASGKVALVQPYLADVDERGETAIVFLGGEFSHALSKRPVLRAEGVAPVAAGELEVAAAMLEEDLVGPGSADAAQEALARQVMAEIAAQFGTPLYARVDLVSDDAGAPVLMELELIEPALYLEAAPGSSERLAAAVRSS